MIWGRYGIYVSAVALFILIYGGSFVLVRFVSVARPTVTESAGTLNPVITPQILLPPSSSPLEVFLPPPSSKQIATSSEKVTPSAIVPPKVTSLNSKNVDDEALQTPIISPPPPSVTAS